MKRRRKDLDRMVDAVLAGEPMPAGTLEPDEVDALRAAIELRAARPAADLPDEEFVTGLRRRISAAAIGESEATAGDGAAPAARIPRRALLAGAAGAVAAGLVGAAAESALSAGSPSRPAAAGTVVPDNGQWVPVTTVSSLAGGRVHRFATATVVGFVTEHKGALTAVSGACTHQGCLLRLDPAGARLDCPCHQTAFGLDGALMYSQLAKPPTALPAIRVRNNDGQVEAYIAPEE